jgi:hypothetical protein
VKANLHLVQASTQQCDYGFLSAESSLLPRADAESAFRNAVPTAFAPGIRERANTLSFSRSVSSCFFSGSPELQANVVAAATASASPTMRDDKAFLLIKLVCL